MNERVKELRKTLGLSGEKFGASLGIQRNAVSQIETGKNSLTEQNIKAICREFNVREEWLRFGTGEMFIKMDDEDYLMEWSAKVLSGKSGEFRKEFVKVLATLPEECWIILEKKILELAEKIKQKDGSTPS